MVAYVLGMRSNKLQRWYKVYLSGFLEAQDSGVLYEHDLDNPDEYIPVPIFNASNLGSHMAIDEKHIDGEYYTILSNKTTGKIALLAQTTRAKYLVELIHKMGDKCMDVKTVSRDLAGYYDWTCRQSFMNAIQIADKFHILKKVLDSVQDLRIFYKQTHLHEKKEHYDNYKDREHRRKIKCKLMGEKYTREKYVAPQQKLANGETLSQVLHRSRTLLFKHKRDWTQSQKSRARVLFEYLPEIEMAYDQMIKFRSWYSTSNIGKPIAYLRKQLFQWYQETVH